MIGVEPSLELLPAVGIRTEETVDGGGGFVETFGLVFFALFEVLGVNEVVDGVDGIGAHDFDAGWTAGSCFIGIGATTG